MSIRINSNFEMGAPLPIDTRFNLTYTEMANINDNIILNFVNLYKNLL